jgi:hypothetical protein
MNGWSEVVTVSSNDGARRLLDHLASVTRADLLHGVNDPSTEPPVAQPCPAKPSQAKPRQAKPRQAKPRQAKPRQAKPRQAKSNVPASSF